MDHLYKYVGGIDQSFIFQYGAHLFSSKGIHFAKSTNISVLAKHFLTLMFYGMSTMFVEHFARTNQSIYKLRTI